MPQTLDEQLAEVQRERAAVCASLQRLDKRRAELNRRLHEVHCRHERLTLAKLVGQPVTFKAGASRLLSERCREASAAGMILTKIGRTRAHIEMGGESWTLPIEFLQDPAAGLKAGMIASTATVGDGGPTA